MKLTAKLKDHFSTLKKNMEGMTFRQKADHIWTYYKETFLVIAILIVILVGLIASAVNSTKPVLVGGVMCNLDLNEEGYAYLTTQFHEDVLDGARGHVQLASSTIYSMDTISAVDETYTAYMSVLAKVEGKDLDYMLMNESSMALYISEGIFLDLRELLTEEELETLAQKEMLIYFQPEGTEDRIPQCIRVSDTAFGQLCVSVDGECYLSFIANSPRRDVCLNIWRYIKTWGTEE